MVQHVTNTAALDHDIEVLATNLATLQDMARSFPVGVTLAADKRAAFDTQFNTVTQQFEHAACLMTASGVPVEAVIS